jgi:hypothetical protein
MPLSDHFHRPWSDDNPSEGFHSAWINTLVRHLNGSLLPPGYRAFPQIHLGPRIEADVPTFERLDRPADPSGSRSDAGDGVGALWSLPEGIQTVEVEWPGQDVFELRVQDIRAGMCLVGLIEMVSPGNKDRPEERQAFVAKCAGYLQEHVGLVVIDVVTTRRANLHAGLLELLSAPLGEAIFPDLDCVAYRMRSNGPRPQLDFRQFPLAVGESLPTQVPLWLGTITIPLDLEKSYQETCAVLRIE